MTGEGLATKVQQAFEVLTKEKRVELEESGWFLRDDALIFWEQRTALSSAHIANLVQEIAEENDIQEFRTPPTEKRRSRHASPGGARRYYYSSELMWKIADSLEANPPRSRSFKKDNLPSIRAELARRIKKRMFGNSK